MAIAYIQKQSASADASGTALNVTVTSTGAARILVVWCKWEGANGSILSISGGGTWVNGTLKDHTNGDLHGQFAYVLSSTSGTTTVTMTLSAARTFRRIHFWEFSYAGTASLDAQITNSSTGATAITSTNITTTGTDEVVLGGYGEYSGDTVTSPLINAVAAAQSLIDSPASTYTGSWERIVTATFTGAATATLSAADPWVCNAISLKAVAGGIPNKAVFIRQAVKRASIY